MNQQAVREPGRGRQPGRSEQGPLLVRVARWVRDTVVDFNQAQRRLAEMMTAPDRYVIGSSKAPDTYEEFLFRTSGLLRHEPPARTDARR